MHQYDYHDYASVTLPLFSITFAERLSSERLFSLVTSGCCVWLVSHSSFNTFSVDDVRCGMLVARPTRYLNRFMLNLLMVQLRFGAFSCGHERCLNFTL